MLLINLTVSVAHTRNQEIKTGCLCYASSSSQPVSNPVENIQGEKIPSFPRIIISSRYHCELARHAFPSLHTVTFLFVCGGNSWVEELNSFGEAQDHINAIDHDQNSRWRESIRFGLLIWAITRRSTAVVAFLPSFSPSPPCSHSLGGVVKLRHFVLFLLCVRLRSVSGFLAHNHSTHNGDPPSSVRL